MTAIKVKNESGESFDELHSPLNSREDIPLQVVNYAMRSGNPVVVGKASEDPLFSKDEYVQKNESKSILCIPFIRNDLLVGIVYFENNLSSNMFTKDRITVLSALSAQIVISLENAHHFEKVENLYRSTERFVPKAFLELLDKKNVEEVQLGDSVKKNISVLFNDIRSFTTLVENRTPEEAFDFVNRYWESMAPAIRKCNGYIDQYQGDAILAIFPGKPEDVVNASILMMETLVEFNKKQKQIGDVEIKMGIGVSTGPAMLGIIGEQERQVSGLISDVANTSARIEGLNKMYGTRILLSEDTVNALASDHSFKLREIDRVILKGKAVSKNIYELIEWEDQLHDISLNEYLKLFERGYCEYLSGDFVAALESLNNCFKHLPNDQSASNLKKRCLEFLKNGVPEDWSGSFVLTQK